MVAGPGVRGTAHRTLVRSSVTVSPGFLDHRLDGTTHCCGTRVFAHGSRHGTLGRPVVLHWNPSISGRASAHAPLPGLIFSPIRSQSMNLAPIYLDHNATTPLGPEVLDAMRPYFLTAGNAESRHAFGRSARRAWELSKETVAR